jgi:tetratricopeptide (TPR) repeat protein
MWDKDTTFPVFMDEKDRYTQKFAEAYAGIAGYYIRQGAWRGQLSPEVARKEALQYAHKALELNPELKSAHIRMGTIKFWYEWDFRNAEMEYKMGGTSEVHGFFLLMMGRFEEAEAMFDELYGRDPFETHDRPHRGVTQYFLGNQNKALRILRSGVNFHPDVLTGYHKLGKIQLAMGQYPDCIETIESGMDICKEKLPAMLSDLAIAYYKTGNMDQFNNLILELEEWVSKGTQGSPSFFMAQAYSGIGEQEKAFEWLEKAYQDREVEMIWLKIEPQFRSIRNDPRYKDLMKKVGF